MQIHDIHVSILVVVEGALEEFMADDVSFRVGFQSLL